MADCFTKEQIDEFRELFDSFDKDGDGRITLQELAAIVESSGWNYTGDELREMIGELGGNADGTIDFDEFLSFIPREKIKTYTDEELEFAFKACDEEQDGYISAKELRNAVVNLGFNVTNKEARYLIHAADADGDGLISYEEFVEIIKAREQ